jgi:ethanolamine ammonia-lyase large subunit
MAKATAMRSGDMLAGIAVTSAEERVAARMCLADLAVSGFSTRCDRVDDEHRRAASMRMRTLRPRRR